MSDEPSVIALPDPTPTYAAVGKGITAFSNVELGVSICFAAMMAPTSRRVADSTFNAARSFEAKMKLIDATAEARLEGEDLKRWRRMSCKITRRKDVRDKLAHWMVGVYPTIKTVDDYKTVKVALVPPFASNAYKALYHGEEHNVKQRPIFLEQLEEFHDLAYRLALELFDFALQLKPPEQPEESSLGQRE